MATLFVEYKDSGKKDANGRAILAKEEEVINIANIQSRLVTASVSPVSAIRTKRVSCRCCCVPAR